MRRKLFSGQKISTFCTARVMSLCNTQPFLPPAALRCIQSILYTARPLGTLPEPTQRRCIPNLRASALMFTKQLCSVGFGIVLHCWTVQLVRASAVIPLHKQCSNLSLSVNNFQKEN